MVPSSCTPSPSSFLLLGPGTQLLLSELSLRTKAHIILLQLQVIAAQGLCAL